MKPAQVKNSPHGSLLKFDKYKGSMLFLEFLAERSIDGQVVRVIQDDNHETMTVFVSYWSKQDYTECAQYINANQ